MNILHIIKRSKAYWIVHILRSNCVLKAVIEEKREGTRRRGRRRLVQLLDYFKEKIKYWTLKKEAIDRNLWRTRFENILTCCETDCVMNVGKLVSHFEDTNQRFPERQPSPLVVNKKEVC